MLFAEMVFLYRKMTQVSLEVSFARCTFWISGAIDRVKRFNIVGKQAMSYIEKQYAVDTDFRMIERL